MNLEALRRAIATALGVDPASNGGADFAQAIAKVTEEQRVAIATALAETSDDDLAAAVTQINAERDRLKTEPASADVLATLRVLAEARKAVDGIATRRAEERAAVAAEAETLLAQLADPAVDPAAADTTVVETTTTTTDTATGEQATDTEVVAVAASANRTVTPGRTVAPGRIGGPTAAPARDPDTVVTTVFKAATASPRYTHGQLVATTADLATLMAEQISSPSSSGDGKVYVATGTTTYPEARHLRSGNWAANHTKVERVVAQAERMDSLVAAGGLCAPLSPDYTVEVFGSQRRPLRDSLPRFGADRGGIMYRLPSSAAEAVNGVGVWTLADDAAVGVIEPGTDVPDPVKACWEVDCPGVTNAYIEAIYLCLQFSNITSRYDPESTAANVQEGMIAHARLAENRLLAKILAGSKVLTSGQQKVGAARHIMQTIDRTVAYYRNRHRIDTALALTMVLPTWVSYLIRADLAHQMAAGDWQAALGVADSEINRWFTERGVQPVWIMDGASAAVTVNGAAIPSQVYANASAGATVPQFPTKFDSALFVSGSWLFLDGGSLDLGLVRDSQLNSKNRYQQFQETFEGAANRGVESLRLVVDAVPSGLSAGTVNPLV